NLGRKRVARIFVFVETAGRANRRSVTLRWPCHSRRSLRTLGCDARPSKGDGPGRPSFEARARERCTRGELKCARPPQDDGSKLLPFQVRGSSTLSAMQNRQAAIANYEGGTLA